MTFTLRFRWRRSRVYVSTWRYGLQFDVQRDARMVAWDCLKQRPIISFKGHLWSWDYRRPFRVKQQDF